MGLHGNECQSLPVPWDPIQTAGEVAAYTADVERTVRGDQGARVKNPDLADVHVRVVGLHKDHRRVECGKPFVM